MAPADQTRVFDLPISLDVPGTSDGWIDGGPSLPQKHAEGGKETPVETTKQKFEKAVL